MKGGIPVTGASQIERGALARIEDGSGFWIHVWDGALWITQEGDRRDYYVRAGDSFELDRDGLALIYAMQRAVVTLTAPAPAQSWLTRLWSGSCARYSNPTTAAL